MSNKNQVKNLVAPVQAFPTVEEILQDPDHPMHAMVMALLAQARAEGAASVKGASVKAVKTAGAALDAGIKRFREDQDAAWTLVYSYGDKVLAGGARRRPEDYRAACVVMFGSADADPTMTALWRAIAKRDGGAAAWAVKINGMGWDEVGPDFILSMIE